MRRWLLILITLAVVAGGIGLWFYLTSPERQIKNALNDLVEAANVEAGEGNLARAARARQIAEGFTPEAVVEWRESESLASGKKAGRAEIQSLILGLFTSVKNLEA